MVVFVVLFWCWNGTKKVGCPRSLDKDEDADELFGRVVGCRFCLCACVCVL